MEALRIFRSLNRDQRNTFLACFLGWTLDALDFFLLTFVVRDVSAEFSVSIVKVTFAITLTLMMRPLGALIFGLLGDRFGRRVPLMVDIIFYSLMELLTAFSPNYTVFLDFSRALRDRDGRRMGTRRVARDGKSAGARARPGLRDFAARLLLRVSPRRGGLLARLPALRVARTFYRRRVCRRCS